MTDKKEPAKKRAVSTPPAPRRVETAADRRNYANKRAGWPVKEK